MTECDSSNNMMSDIDSDIVDIDKYKFSYLSKVSKMNKDILTQEKVLAKYFGDRWNDMPQERRDLLLDFMFVDDDIRGQYDSGNNKFKWSSGNESENEIQESFPRLHLHSGQKINVDFESDLWTWRDEHSGPFSWYSRSQQDLTLADLEPGVISKPQPKTAQTDGSDGKVTTADAQFAYPSSCWCHDVINEFRKHEDKITISPSTSMILPTTRARAEAMDRKVKVENEEVKVKPVVEEVKPAVESYDNVPTPAEVEKQEDEIPSSIVNSRRQTEIVKNTDRRSRSPSPKKMNRSGSLKKTSVKTSEVNLINRHDDDTNDRNNAFSNRAMESQWSTFVGETHDETHRSEPVSEVMRSAPFKSAPQPLVIDRGSEPFTASPYHGDRDRLIQAQSPLIKSAIASSAAYSSPMSGSGESSPDHTTYLLKGMQAHTNPQFISTQPLNCVKYPDMPRQTGSEEVLRVETSGQRVTAVKVTQQENKRDSDVPETVTGFDFLDNW